MGQPDAAVFDVPAVRKYLSAPAEKGTTAAGADATARKEKPRAPHTAKKEASRGHLLRRTSLPFSSLADIGTVANELTPSRT
jgi:hypothetical protein